MTEVLFYVSGSVAVLATFLFVIAPNAIHALLNLIVSFLAIAMVFLLLGAPFAAALEVIIYAGAVMVLFVFVIMMLQVGPESVEQERRCWPREALSIFDAFRQQLVDHAARGRVVHPGVVRVTAKAPAWMRFPGTWGEDQYVAFPNNPPFRFGAGPEGPAFHALWQRPFATPLGWRRD